jgi:hypothetical protein
MEEPKAQVCAVCARVLNPMTNEKGEMIGWMHAIGTADELDHPAVPVAPTDVQTRYLCDFCNGEDPVWTLPVRGFDVPKINEDQKITGTSGENWAACADCAALIDRNQWSALLRRVISGWELRYHVPMDPKAQTNLSASYRLLRKNITGPLRPFDPEQDT